MSSNLNAHERIRILTGSERASAMATLRLHAPPPTHDSIIGTTEPGQPALRRRWALEDPEHVPPILPLRNRRGLDRNVWRRRVLRTLAAVNR